MPLFKTLQDVRLFLLIILIVNVIRRARPPCLSLRVRSPGTTQSILLSWLEAAGIRVCCLAQDKKFLFSAKAFRQPVCPT